MGKCQIIGKIRIPVNAYQAVLINNKLCSEETVWTIDEAYGGESYSTDFTITNRSSVTFDITWDISTPTDGSISAGVYESDGITLVTPPLTINAESSTTYKFKVDLDKYISDDTYEIIITYDFV